MHTDPSEYGDETHLANEICLCMHCWCPDYLDPKLLNSLKRRVSDPSPQHPLTATRRAGILDFIQAVEDQRKCKRDYGQVWRALQPKEIAKEEKEAEQDEATAAATFQQIQKDEAKVKAVEVKASEAEHSLEFLENQKELKKEKEAFLALKP